MVMCQPLLQAGYDPRPQVQAQVLEPQSKSLSKIIVPLLQQVRVSLVFGEWACHILSPPPPHAQYGEGQDEGGRGVTTIQSLIQSFKIAERSSPGFCDTLVLQTIAQLQKQKPRSRRTSSSSSSDSSS